MSRTTVGAMLDSLGKFDRDMPVEIHFAGGGGVVIEARDLVHEGNGETVVGIYNDNGGRFGHDVLTENEYQKRSLEFLDGLLDTERQKSFGMGFKRFTTIHGDYRIYTDLGGSQDTCYGIGYDERIIKRMVNEGLLEFYKQQYSRDGVKLTDKGRKYFDEHPR